jgi:hypothetical protein
MNAAAESSDGRPPSVAPGNASACGRPRAGCGTREGGQRHQDGAFHDVESITDERQGRKPLSLRAMDLAAPGSYAKNLPHHVPDDRDVRTDFPLPKRSTLTTP